MARHRLIIPFDFLWKFKRVVTRNILFVNVFYFSKVNTTHDIRVQSIRRIEDSKKKNTPVNKL